MEPLPGCQVAGWRARRSISCHLVFLAGARAKVGAFPRRLRALRFAFTMPGLAEPTPGHTVDPRYCDGARNCQYASLTKCQ